MNWAELIKELIEVGMPQVEIARQIGMTPPSIIDITSGRQKSLRWEVGTALLALHAKNKPAA